VAERLTTERLRYLAVSPPANKVLGYRFATFREEAAMAHELLRLRARVAALERKQPMAPSGQPAATDRELAESAWSLSRAVERRLGELEALFPKVEEPGPKGLGVIRMLSCREVAEMVCIEREVSGA
jgi:hypothetical protein